MKILQLISSSGFYGAERVLLELAIYLQRQGHESHVGVFLHDQDENVRLLQEARRHNLRTITFACQGRLDCRTTRQIRQYIVEQRLDVVHSHGYKADIYLSLAQLPDEVTRVATCHNWLSNSLSLLAYELLDKIVLHSFDHVVGVSTPLMQELARAGLDAGRCSLIHNGLDLPSENCATAREQLRREFAIAPEELVLINIGRMDLYKDHLLLIESLDRIARAAECKLMIVGDGDLRAQIEARVGELNLSARVILTGYRQDVSALLRASDLFVLSSNKEGLPMVLLEAMAAGLPIVSTNVGAIPDVLNHGQDALLVPPRQPQALADAALELLSRPDLRQQMSKRLLCKFEREYSQRAMGERYLELYQRLRAAA